MRRNLLKALVVGAVTVPLLGVAALATADDRERGSGSERGSQSASSTTGGVGFEIDIDPELDARFGPRPVNAVQAAAIVTERFPGARVLEAELDEENGRPIWEIEFVLGGSEREVDVDATNGAILGGGDDEDEDDGDRDDD